MRWIVWMIVLLSIVASACSSAPNAQNQVQTSKGAPGPGQSVFPVVASSEIIVGANRLQIGLIDQNDAPVRSPKTTLQVGFLGPDDQEPSSETTMSFVWTINHHKGRDIREWAEENNVELLFTPTYASWANPIECHLGAIRQFVLKNCNYPSHRALAARLHAYLRWRNTNRRDPKLLRVVRAEQRRIRAERMLRKAA